jgi:hypothetical protein
VLSMFAGFGFDWPPFIKAIFNAFSLLNFNFELLVPECSLSVNFETKWCVSLLAVHSFMRAADWPPTLLCTCVLGERFLCLSCLVPVCMRRVPCCDTGGRKDLMRYGCLSPSLSPPPPPTQPSID